MKIYKRLFEITRAEDMTQAAHNALETVQDMDIQDDVQGLMDRVNKQIKHYMKKKNYVEDSDVTSFATAIQERAISEITAGVTPGEEWKLVSIVLAMAVSLGLKTTQAKSSEQEKSEESPE